MDQPRFQILPLDLKTFQPLFAKEDQELRRQGVRRVKATSKPGFPCRVSLVDAEVGESLLLLTHLHHGVDSPYRASGPIYVRENAQAASLAPGDLPGVAAPGRQLSVRAYSANGMMRNAAACDGAELGGRIEALFEDPKVAYLHVHNALPGCFSCRVERVGGSDPEPRSPRPS